jgi:hypothetical protein
MTIDRALLIAPPGTVIPKPAARGSFRVKGAGTRRGEPALIYTIPNHRNRRRPYEKGITARELTVARRQLLEAGEFNRQWFIRRLPDCAAEGSCNFTTIGGLFELAGIARYEGPGLYRRVRRSRGDA